MRALKKNSTFVLISHLFSVLMSYENVELMFSDADCLPDLFRKSRKGSIYLTPYRVGMMKEGKSFGADFSDQLAARNKSCFFF